MINRPESTKSREGLRIGTRRSSLALAQTQIICDNLARLSPALVLSTVPMVTTGDKRQGTPEAGKGDKKEWVAELEEALVAGDIQVAIHSGKDVPVVVHENTLLLPVLPREHPYDVIVHNGSSEATSTLKPSQASVSSTGNVEQIIEDAIAKLASGSSLGTASARRRAQVRTLRPDIRLVELRGNVSTRLEKLQRGEVDALMLAEAGLRRLSSRVKYSRIAPTTIVPAMSQGILVAHVRKNDSKTIELFSKLVEPQLEPVFRCERDIVRRIGADCRSALGVYATLDNNTLHVLCRVLSESTGEIIEISDCASVQDEQELSGRVAEDLLSSGARRLLESGRVCS